MRGRVSEELRRGNREDFIAFDETVSSLTGSVFEIATIFDVHQGTVSETTLEGWLVLPAVSVAVK